MLRQLIADQKFTSIQQAQAGLSRLFADADKNQIFYRVMRNNQPLGVLIPDSIFEDWIEDMEAMHAKSYINKIKKARQSKKTYSLQDVKKEFNL